MIRVKKSSKELIDDYDYLANAASAHEYTGLIPFLPTSEAELESYNAICHLYPPGIPIKDSAENNQKF